MVSLVKETKRDKMTKVGLELELLVTDREGRVVNDAEKILDDPRCSDNVVKESTFGVVEFVSTPHDTLYSLDQEVRSELIGLSEIADSYGLITIPISDLSPEGNNIRRFDNSRYKFNSNILGQEGTKTCNAICGTHIHLDKQKEDISQYNLVESLDPVFAFLSTSPYLQGQNTLNDCRVNSYRNKVFEKFPLHGQLVEYLNSASHRDQQDEIRYSTWLDLAGDPSAKDHYTMDNTCWGPMRTRSNTIEARGNDTNILSNIIAMAAFYKGVNDYVKNNKLEVKIGDDYNVTSDSIIIPSYANLKSMEEEGIRHGLKSDKVHGYLRYLMDIANDGLDSSERKYLKPFKQMLVSKNNMANVLKDYSRNIGSQPGQELEAHKAHRMNVAFNEVYQADLAGKLDLEIYGLRN